jgi:putative holliday junction resolvase
VRVIAFDIGTVRVGVAVSDEAGIIASPAGVVSRSDDAQEDAGRLAEIARSRGAERIVIGMPISLRGEREIAAQQMEQFAALLREAAEVEVVEWDERMTTAIAERAMIEGDVSRMERRGKIDQVAAAVLLQGYLDAERRGK